jgi:hypothetical protein
LSDDEKAGIPGFNPEDEHLEEMEPLAQITSLFGEHYSEGGLKTIHGICSIKESIILDIDNSIMRRNLLNGNFNKNSRRLIYAGLTQQGIDSTPRIIVQCLPGQWDVKWSL